MDSPPFVVARAPEQVQDWLRSLGSGGVLAVDTETTGWDPLSDRLRSVQVAAGPGVPVLVVDADRLDVRVLAPILGDDAFLKVFHHGAFDLRFLAVAGVRIRRVADTMLAQQLLDGGDPSAGSRSLAALAAFRLGLELDKDVRSTFGDAAPLSEEQVRYAALDAWATWGIFDQQWRELSARSQVPVARLEFAALPVLADLQLRGVAFDAPRWRSVVGRLEGEVAALAARAQDALVSETTPCNLFGPEPVNLDSPEQVRDALARLGVEVESTRESVLARHRGHPAIDALLAYRQVTKVTSNWGGDWADRVAHPVTRRVHADWRQIVGGGRIACSEPNLTQIPKDARYRACFGGRPGRALVVADYSQQELRILAAVSGDEALKEVFRSGGDLHRATAALAFGVDEQSVTPAQRAAAKALNFGLMYGMGVGGFAAATGMDRSAAQATIDAYFAAFPRVASWLAEVEATARRSGKVRTALGRVRTLAGEGGPIPATLARNAPIQGAGADMTKLALAAVDERLRSRFGGPPAGAGNDGLVLVVHDELVAEVPAEDAEEAAKLVVDGMLAAASAVLGDVPAGVDVGVRPRWGTHDTGGGPAAGT